MVVPVAPGAADASTRSTCSPLAVIDTAATRYLVIRLAGTARLAAGVQGEFHARPGAHPQSRWWPDRRRPGPPPPGSPLPGRPARRFLGDGEALAVPVGILTRHAIMRRRRWPR